MLHPLQPLEKALPAHAPERFSVYSDVKASGHDAYPQVVSPWERQHLLLNVQAVMRSV